MTLLLKLVLAPMLVVRSSLAGRRWGAGVSGMLVAFPIVAGPILLITTLEQGVEFGARAASASLLGLISLAVFAVVFAHAGRRLPWPATLAVSWAAVLAGDLLLSRRAAGPGWGLALVLIAAAVAYRLVSALDGAAGPAPVRLPWWDLPARAIATALLVLVVTGSAAAAGPELTGVLAPFPTAISVVVAFALAQQGPAAAIRTLAGVARGLAGFALYCFLLAVLLEPVGVAGAFAIATAGPLLSAGWEGRRRFSRPHGRV